MGTHNIAIFVIILVSIFFMLFTLNEHSKATAEGSTDITLLVVAMMFFIVLMLCFVFILYRRGTYYYTSS